MTTTIPTEVDAGMSKARRLQREAANLLRVAKTAYKFIRDSEVGSEAEREKLLEELQAVIDRADPPVFDEDLTTVKLTMTNASADTLLDVLTKKATDSAEDRETFNAFKRGLRRTKQRAYCRLELDATVLRRLRYVLLHTKVPHQDAAFSRLALEIEEGLKQNPMQILGKMAL